MQARDVIRCGLACAVSTLALVARAASDDPFAIQTLATEGRIVQADLVELDGDGRGDLICIGIQGLPPDESREIRVFYQQPDGSLPPVPDWRVRLPPGVAAYDLAPLDASPGVELLLLRRDRLTVLSLSGREPAFRDLKVGVDPTMAVAPDEGGVDRLRMARSGLADELRLVVPGLGETLVLTTSGEALGRLDVGARANFFLSPQEGPVIAENELELHLAHPRISIGDVDGDGRGDIVSSNRHELRVFLQREDGHFSRSASRRLALHRITQQDHMRSSGAVRVMPADFNNDGRLDLLISTSHGSLLDANTDVTIHLNRGGGWDLEHPDQVFHTESGLTASQVIDIDGDGRAELISIWIPTGVLEVVELLVTRAIDAQVAIYRHGEELPFDEKPWYQRKLGLPWSFETLHTRGFVPTLTVDVNGDDMLDFLGSGNGDELEVRLGNWDHGYAGRQARQKLDTGGRIRFGDLDGDGLTDFVLYDPRRPDTPVRVGLNRGVLPNTPHRPTLQAPTPSDALNSSVRGAERSEALLESHRSLYRTSRGRTP